MKRVGLLRHAKSDWSDQDKRDHDRGLNRRGRLGAKLMGEHIAAEGTDWQLVLASTATRVRLTAASALPDAEITFDAALYLASAEVLADALSALPDTVQSVLLVGHNPGLQNLVLTLVRPDAENALFDAAKEKFPTATFAIIELPDGPWSEAVAAGGTLTHFTRPRDLDARLAPEP
ncbi:histidine phosphatase family protein [Erythrobacteraceae bacterium CFH 75059]|uniref:SixA phosphatase family protein n=1 Tax=Qipengyuania thermophila TaxID=2509361 RepID=UPI001020A418|nr:histidine phosphatase family protein [Qipengyuania thermophila]TCD04966.1 histidine phosphatase family protein [Erythrobacteraceae bacterium CFH 75059]